MKKVCNGGSARFSDSPLFRYSIVPTLRYSENPFFRQPILLQIPTVLFLEILASLFLQLVIPTSWDFHGEVSEYRVVEIMSYENNRLSE